MYNIKNIKKVLTEEPNVNNAYSTYVMYNLFYVNRNEHTEAKIKLWKR